MKWLAGVRGAPIAQQVVALMILALAVITFVNIAIVVLQPPPPRQVKELAQVVARLKPLYTDVQAMSAAQRRTVLERASDPAMQYSIVRGDMHRYDSPLNMAINARVASQLNISQDQVAARSSLNRNNFVRQLVQDSPPTPAALDAWPFFGNTRIAVRLPSGEWLVAQNPRRPEDFEWLRFIGLSFVGAMLLLIPLALLFARRLAAPIARFADGAERLGRDPNSPLLVEQGPAELRQAVRSFNTMQDRLRRFVADRTLMLAAISHDLRTPLQRMRFRIDSLPDDARTAMLADIEEMEAMVNSTLTFSRDDATPGTRETLDLGALVSSICDEATDSGGEAQCAVQDRVVVNGDPVRLKRALDNLVSNALKYAGGVEVTVSRQSGLAVVDVADRGPGIPKDFLEDVFQPFRRLEPSRNRGTGGVGLGLAIARTIARAHGGDVTLTARDGGGLNARLALPA
jgi:signal transduction histidine kinase